MGPIAAGQAALGTPHRQGSFGTQETRQCSWGAEDQLVLHGDQRKDATLAGAWSHPWEASEHQIAKK